MVSIHVNDFKGELVFMEYFTGFPLPLASRLAQDPFDCLAQAPSPHRACVLCPGTGLRRGAYEVPSQGKGCGITEDTATDARNLAELWVG